VTISPTLYDYEIENVVRVIDGDTFDLTVAWEVDHGFYLKERKRWTTRFRLYGIDIFEPSTILGREATKFAATWLADRAGILRATTYKPDSFGRWLADIYSGDGKMRDAMREAGFMKPDSKWNL